MYDADALEAINFEQLVTATDRMLLRGGRVSRRRPTAQLRTLQPQLHASRAPAPVAEPPARGSQSGFERTAFVRHGASSQVQVFAVTVVIPALVGIAVGFAALL